jgi:hypothetical protein
MLDMLTTSADVVKQDNRRADGDLRPAVLRRTGAARRHRGQDAGAVRGDTRPYG